MLFFISLIGIVVITGIVYAIFPAAEVLWFGGALAVFWASDRIRREVEDNVYISAAWISLTAMVATIPQIFLVGTVTGYIHFLLSSLFLILQTLTHRDHLSKYIDKRYYAPIRNNDKYTRHEKNYHREVMVQGNWAAMVLLMIVLGVAMATLGALSYVYSPWFIPLPAVFVTLANMAAIFYMQLVGVQPPRGQIGRAHV